VAIRGLGGVLGGEARCGGTNSGAGLTRVGTVGGLLGGGGIREGTPGLELKSALGDFLGDGLGDGLGVMISSTRHWLGGGSILRMRPIRTAISRSGSSVPRCEEPNKLRSVTDNSSSIFFNNVRKAFFYFWGPGTSFFHFPAESFFFKSEARAKQKFRIKSLKKTTGSKK
jgi:hypothetical protein